MRKLRRRSKLRKKLLFSVLRTQTKRLAVSIPSPRDLKLILMPSSKLRVRARRLMPQKGQSIRSLANKLH